MSRTFVPNVESAFTQHFMPNICGTVIHGMICEAVGAKIYIDRFTEKVFPYEMTEQEATDAVEKIRTCQQKSPEIFKQIETKAKKLNLLSEDSDFDSVIDELVLFLDNCQGYKCI